MIEFENVVKQYPDGVRAVDGLSLHVPEGEICVLIGPSGCGKTTSMRMVNCLISITSGRIVVDGQDNREVAAEELRRKIGYAIQQIGLFPHMTVFDNIAVVPRLLEWEEPRIRKRVDELLELVGLDADVNRSKYPRQLSGGQQQRVGVARALGADPPIMLMDEPFGAVDPITRETLQAEFLGIQRAIGKTIIFVTHDIDEAIKMGDRVAVMRAGKLVQYDAPDDLLAKPTDAFVRDFVGADRQLKRLGLVRVQEIMDPHPPVVAEDGTREEALEVVSQPGLNSAFVVDRHGKLKGWVSEELLAAAASLADAAQRAPLREVAARESATLREALSVMLSSGFGATPVVDDEGRLVGSVTLEALKEHAEEREVQRDGERTGDRAGERAWERDGENRGAAAKDDIT